MRIRTECHMNLYTWAIGVQYSRFFGDRSFSIHLLCFNVSFKWSIHNSPLGIFNTPNTFPNYKKNVTFDELKTIMKEVDAKVKKDQQ